MQLGWTPVVFNEVKLIKHSSLVLPMVSLGLAPAFPCDVE